MGYLKVVKDIREERNRQDEKWGEQNHEDGTGGDEARKLSNQIRDWCDFSHLQGVGTWVSILAEELMEAYAETDPDRLRKELVEVAAVAVAWIECIDRRGHP